MATGLLCWLLQLVTWSSSPSTRCSSAASISTDADASAFLPASELPMEPGWPTYALPDAGEAALLRALRASQDPSTGPKIYLYPPPSFDHPFNDIDCRKAGEEFVNVTIFMDHHWEFLLPQQLRALPNVVSKPSDADLFVFANNASCYERVLYSRDKPLIAADGSEIWNFPDEVYRQYLKPYVLEIKQQPYFRRFNGSDHVTPFSKDFGACWRPMLRSLLGQTTIVQCYGMHEGNPARAISMAWPAKTRGCFDPWRNIVVPPYRPALTRWVHPGDAAATGDGNNGGAVTGVTRLSERPTLAYFAGRIPDTELGRSAGVRQLFKLLMANPQNTERGLLIHDTNPPPEQRALEMDGSKFCLTPTGIAQWTPRPYDCWAAGSVPVLIGDGAVQPFERFIDYRAISLKLSHATTVFLVPVLEQAMVLRGVEAMERRQALGRAMLRHLLWTGDPRVSAVGMLVLELACRFYWPVKHPKLAIEHCNRATYRPTAFDAWL